MQAGDLALGIFVSDCRSETCENVLPTARKLQEPRFRPMNRLSNFQLATRLPNFMHDVALG